MTRNGTLTEKLSTQILFSPCGEHLEIKLMTWCSNFYPGPFLMYCPNLAFNLHPKTMLEKQQFLLFLVPLKEKLFLLGLPTRCGTSGVIRPSRRQFVVHESFSSMTPLSTTLTPSIVWLSLATFPQTKTYYVAVSRPLVSRRQPFRWAS